MMENDAVKQEMGRLFGERKKPETKQRKKGSAMMLIIALCLSVALTAWPFVKTLFHDPPQEKASLYYKVPADPTITPAVLNDEIVDILFFTGCAHQRRASRAIQLDEGGKREI